MTTDERRADFRNRLCILRSIDHYELEQAGVSDLANQWPRLRDDPLGGALRMTGSDFEKLWKIMEERSAR